MSGLLRRKLHCHYCNSSSQNDHAGIPRTWLCPYCDAVNHLDERGEITDPPVEATVTAPARQYVRSRATTPTMVAPAPVESPFCDTCQRNQLLLNKTLAEYIPDEDDPEYEKYAASVDEYRAQLEERYPQVCEDCVDRVQAKIRAAGYAAKADNLRRVLEQGKKYRTSSYTRRQLWTLAIIWLAKWTYAFSVVIGLLWHGFGMIVSPNTDDFDGKHFSWGICLMGAIEELRVHETCLLSTYMLQLVKYALIADGLTFWWNPKLNQKTNRAGGRMRGVVLVWIARIAVLVLRLLSFRILRTVESDMEHLQKFHYTHGVIFVALLISTTITWKTVRITYQSTKSLMQPLDAHLPSAPPTVKNPKRSAATSALPNNTSFDTMAQSFTSSFPTRDNEPNLAFPPSPTLTSISSISRDSDVETPYRRTTRSSTRGDDSMDWTPTQKRFAPHSPTVFSSTWRPSSPPAVPTPSTHKPQSHSLFSKPDPNPFRHKVPSAPKGPIASKLDPWKPGVWAPPLKETTKNFFKENKTGGQGLGESEGLQGLGVPKNVQRDAELFEAPKLKYEYFGKMKETGLEGSFNDLFSK